ncbi:MAG: carbohydrate ABC transporter permease [Caldilineaceae bacterium]
MIHHYRKRWVSVLRWVLLAVLVFACVFPIYFMLTTSFKYPIQTYEPSIWLFYPTAANYQSLFQNYEVAARLLNSVIVTVGSVILALILGGLAAYGFAKYEFRGKENIAGWMLSMRFLPAMAVVIPLFLIANTLHVLDTQALLIVVYLTFNVPFAAWMLRGFFDEIPVELEDAAMVDGASRWQILLRIVLPLSTPGIFATAALLVIATWNEFTLALFLATYQARTMPTVTSQFQTVRGILWGELTALGVLTTLPVLVFAILARKYLVRGLTFGALK